jgi:hypothetical protein
MAVDDRTLFAVAPAAWAVLEPFGGHPGVGKDERGMTGFAPDATRVPSEGPASGEAGESSIGIAATRSSGADALATLADSSGACFGASER